MLESFGVWCQNSLCQDCWDARWCCRDLAVLLTQTVASRRASLPTGAGWVLCLALLVREAGDSRVLTVRVEESITQHSLAKDFMACQLDGGTELLPPGESVSPKQPRALDLSQSLLSRWALDRIPILVIWFSPWHSYYAYKGVR